jgi:ribonucleoside-diphosphate reductase alpha chain
MDILTMLVVKRDGRTENVSLDKIFKRIEDLVKIPGYELSSDLSVFTVCKKTIDLMTDQISTETLDKLSGGICGDLITTNYDYSKLGARILISNLIKNLKARHNVSTFAEMTNLIAAKIPNYLSENYVKFVRYNASKLDAIINNNYNYMFDFFGFKTLEQSYLIKDRLTNETFETPQTLWLRVAIAIHMDVNDMDNENNLEQIRINYNYLGRGLFTHATPTLFNAATKVQQLSSCYLLGTDDSIEGIFKTVTDCAHISKWAGGIGIHISNIRSKGQTIKSTNGQSSGIVPMLKLLNETGRFVNQCFTPDTWVYSFNGPKQMKDITTNDHLVTVDGSYKKVNQVVINDVNQEILEIRASNTLFPVRVTREHEIYVIRGQKKMTNISNIIGKLNNHTITPEYIPAAELSTDDIFGYPIPTYVEDNDITDLDYYKFYGMMLGDGHMCENKTECGITLSVNKKEELVRFTQEYLARKNVHTWTNAHNDCVQIKWTNIPALQLNRNMLYDENDEKRICASYLHLPKPKILKILEGLLKTDGSNLKELLYYSSSQLLIMQLRYLFLRMGVLTAGYVRDYIGESHVTVHGKEITTKKLSYVLRIPKHPNLSDIITFTPSQYFKYFEWNGMLWGRLKSIETTHYVGQVYDFNMIDNHNYLTDMGLVHNSGKRNGSIAIYLEPHHADIMDFLELRKNGGNEHEKCRDLFLALWVSDRFMRAVENEEKWYLMSDDQCPGLTDVYGEEYDKLYQSYVDAGNYVGVVDAKTVWQKMMSSQMETGTPYILFKDHVNRKSNQKNIGVVRSSNLCVHEDTQILTNKGYVRIKDVKDREVEIWNGAEWSKVIVRQTGANKNLVRVNLSNGSYLDCTPEHKFYVQMGYKPKIITETNAANLRPGEKLIKYELPDVTDFDEGDDEFNYPYTHGFYCGDGTDYDNYSKTEKYAKVYLYGDKKALMEHITYTNPTEPIIDPQDRITLILPRDIAPKFTVPLNKNINIKLRWLEGYCDADGIISRNGTDESLQIGSINKPFLLNVRYMLHTLGIESKITLSRNEGLRTMPDGKDGSQEYVYRLLISSSGLYKLACMGFAPKRLKYEIREPQICAEQFVQIVDVEPSFQNVDTYCFTEPKRHMGVFNGILTGQCAEIVEYSDDKEYAVCNLASIAINKFYDVNTNTYDHEQLHVVTKQVTYNLNKIIDINFYPTAETKCSNLKNRPIGVGIQGFADLLFMMKIPYESDYALKLSAEILETIYHACMEASNELAIVYGPYQSFNGSPMSQGQFQFDMWKDGHTLLSDRYNWKLLRESIMMHGTRNSLLTALMPTASTSQILGNIECFEPITSNLYSRLTLSGNFVILNKYLQQDLMKLSLWNENMQQQITLNYGSIQNIDVIPKELKEVYKTVWEIKQKAIIDHALKRGPFVDQSQSMNLYFANPDPLKLRNALFYGWRNGIKTGMYYLRSQPAANAQQTISKEKKEVKVAVTEVKECIMCSS